MNRTISINAFLFVVGLAFLMALAAAITLPHDRYYRFQSYDTVSTRKADWIYERLHFDQTPIDVALIGTSRLAGGLSAPSVEALYCAATGRRIHVANLALPQTGRNMHDVIVKELLGAKAPSLIVVELNDVEPRRPHPGFIFLADAKDIFAAPLLLNMNFLTDLLRLPGRQFELFIETVTADAPLRKSFDPGAYVGSHMDRTETIIDVDGVAHSQDVEHTQAQMETMRSSRAARLSPLHILPAPLRKLEYRFSRIYLRRIEERAKHAGAGLEYIYAPAYGAPAFSQALGAELDTPPPSFSIGGELTAAHQNWKDATHLNTRGAQTASRMFARQLAETYPSLGADGCN